MRRLLLLAAVCCLLPALARGQDLPLEGYNGGFFTAKIPHGWTVTTAGQCAEFAYLIRDPQNPLRMVFGIGQAGPVYLSPRQKQIDAAALRMGAAPVPWFEMPVVAPLTPTNFLVQFHLLAATNIARRFMPQCPRLERFQPVSTRRVKPLVQNGTTELVRGLFVQDGRVAEGQFLASVAPFMPMTGGPGAGTGMGMLIYGIAAPREEFPRLERTLAAISGSMRMDPGWVRNCLNQSNKRWAGVRRAGKTLSETSDIITKGWEARNRTDDIISQKRSDAMLGYERVYDPATRQVYSVPNGFYEKYDRSRQRYNMNNLQRLPAGDHGLWTAPARDGGSIN